MPFNGTIQFCMSSYRIACSHKLRFHQKLDSHFWILFQFVFWAPISSVKFSIATPPLHLPPWTSIYFYFSFGICFGWLRRGLFLIRRDRLWFEGFNRPGKLRHINLEHRPRRMYRACFRSWRVVPFVYKYPYFYQNAKRSWRLARGPIPRLIEWYRRHRPHFAFLPLLPFLGAAFLPFFQVWFRRRWHYPMNQIQSPNLPLTPLFI